MIIKFQLSTTVQLYVGGLMTEPSATLPDLSGTSQQLPIPTYTQHVQIPDNRFHPCQILLNSLQTTIDPLGSSTDFGKSLYMQTVRLAGIHLSGSCNNCV